MLKRWNVVFLIAVAAVVIATSCSSIAAYWLIKELLDEKAPRREWRGLVTDRLGFGIEDAKVTVTATVVGDDDDVAFNDLTNASGEYEIKFRWHEDIRYSLTVDIDNHVVAEKYEGRVELHDQTTDFSIDTFNVSASLFGVVSDFRGDPLAGVLVLGATVDSPTGTPEVLEGSDGLMVWATTDSAGYYEIDGGLLRYGIICAYHPDFGWAYSYDDEKRSNGSINLDTSMGRPGSYTVQVQVVDAQGQPISDQILSAERRFRVRFDQPFDLSTDVDQIVDGEGLFPDLVGLPSNSHPARQTLSVIATLGNGFAEDFITLAGGNYHIDILKIDSGTPATADMQSANPLVLYETTVLTVRVN